MKKILNIIWSIILLGILIGWGINYWSGQKEKSNTSIKQLVDNLFEGDDNICLITVGYGDCQLCEVLLNDDNYRNLELPKFYIDALKSIDNKRFMQALYTNGFPTTYVVNHEYEVLGVIKGQPFWGIKLDSICNLSERICDIEIENVEKDSVLGLFTMSFRALMCYWKNDHRHMKEYALNSFEYGSYFFNNYLMYLVYKEENKQDSAFIYKEKALQQGHHVSAFIYDDLIEELKNNQ